MEKFLKGTFDKQKSIHRFIVTGSAKLDIYNKGQEPILGRLLSWRVRPLCLAQLKHQYQFRSLGVIPEQQNLFLRAKKYLRNV